MRIVVVTVMIIAAWASSASAFQFSTLFKTTNHDFGTVARAANTEYRFTFENQNNQTIHVRSVRASCGCTTPFIETETVPPGARGSISVKLNTGTHVGEQAATVTVTLDKPSFGEVQLHVKAYVRSDVAFQPSEAAFGNIQHGTAKSIKIAVDYLGKPTWEINLVTSSDTFISVLPREVSRKNGRVRYSLAVSISGDAPVGPLESELVVYTNERSMTTFPLRLTANIASKISISPQTLSLGDVFEGESIKQVIVLKGQIAFRIDSVESKEFEIESSHGEDRKSLHALHLILKPKAIELRTEIKGKITFTTDLPEMREFDVGIVFRTKLRSAK